MKKHILLCIVGISYFAHAAIEFRYKEDPYSTHQPILYEIVTQTTGPIIEFDAVMVAQICSTSYAKKTEEFSSLLMIIMNGSANLPQNI